MPDKTILLAALIMAAVTAAVRAAPFVLFARRKTPAVLTYLGRCLPCAVMGMLVVYCLRGMSFAPAGSFLPEVLAGAVVVGSYVRKRNTLLSILGGTVCYMLLVKHCHNNTPCQKTIDFPRFFAAIIPAIHR